MFKSKSCFCSLQARLNEMMSQIRLQKSQAGERIGRADGKYVVEGVVQEQLKQVRRCEKRFFCFKKYKSTASYLTLIIRFYAWKQKIKPAVHEPVGLGGII